IFSTIKVVSRHQDTQQYGAILPIELMNEDIRNTMAYKEYYACATGVAAPKPKASARKKRDKGTGSRPGVPDVPSDDSEEELSWNSFEDEDVDAQDEGDKNDESDNENDDGTLDRNWNKTLPAAQGNAQSWISELARQTDARSSFNELLDT
nr:hypothetical protein [Tanacetum cinerariifolium]